MNQTMLFAVAWLVIGLAWAYRSIAKKEFAGLLIAAGFVLLALFFLLRTQ